MHTIASDRILRIGLAILATVLISIFAGCDSSPDKTTEESEARSSDPLDDLRVKNVAEPYNLSQNRGNRIGITSQPPVKSNVDPKSFELTERSHEFDISFLSWNVESEGADPDVISEQLSALNDQNRYDIVGLTEVLPESMPKYQSSLGDQYKYVFTKSGWNDRMQILYNQQKFDEVRHFEIKKINILDRYRAPLVLHLKHKQDDSELLVMINHLARGKAEVRQKQAEMLVEWAREQTLPVVAIGDYNFDYVFETQKGNPAFAKFMTDNIWAWIRPEKFIDTNWYDDPRNPDGQDDYPGSMLDFAFLAQGAKQWKATCKIIMWKNDFPDDMTTSDHRPFELLIDVD